MRNTTVRFFTGTAFMFLAIVVALVLISAGVNKNIAVGASCLCLVIALWLKLSCFWIALKDGRKMVRSGDEHMARIRELLKDL